MAVRPSESGDDVDTQRFDRLTRSLALSRGRRDALKLFAGSILGLGAVASIRPLTLAQDCSGIQEPCTSDDDCCDGFTCNETNICIALAECAAEGEGCAADDQCCGDAICCAGFCRSIECCIDEADPNARCPAGTSCFEGVCDPIGSQTGGSLPNTGTGVVSAEPDLGALGAVATAALIGSVAIRKLGKTGLR